MKKKLFKYTGILLILFFLLCLTACWDRKELDDLAIVSGIAVDYDQETEQVRLTAQIIKAGEVGQSQEGGSGGSTTGEEPQAAWVVESTAETVFEAVRAFTFQSSRKLYFPHNNIIVFSKEIAEKGIRPYISFFIRDPATRTMVWVLIAEGQASDVMRVKTDLEKIPAAGIARMIENRVVTSQISGTTLQDFTSMLLSKTTAPVASHIHIFEEDGEKKAYIEGSSVFKGDKLSTYLNKKETRGLLWIKGEVKSGITVIKDPMGKKISVEITKSSSQIEPEIINDKYIIKLKVSSEANIGEQMGDFNLATGKVIAYLEKENNGAIKKEIKAVIEKAQRNRTDIFGFGEAFHRKYPRQWKTIEANWGNIFSQLDIQIEIDSHIRQIGVNVKAPIPE